MVSFLISGIRAQMGPALFYGTLIIFMNRLVDLAYGLLDPKVRYD